jgi:hypothetical protein
LHFVIAFAAAGWGDIQTPDLPNLSHLLARLSLTARDDGEADTLSPPHERALAAAHGWQGADGRLPFAAQAGAADGITVGDDVWGLITPVHWQVGREHVTLADPAALNLTENQSRSAFNAVRDLFESEGWRFEWGAPLRWYAAHDTLADLPCAALDRVIGRDVERWMRGEAHQHPATKLVRRLQSELQLLLYTHPLNEEREQNGELSLNSFWLTGCGRFQAPQGAGVQFVTDLREPSLAQNATAWAQAWQHIDQTHLATARQVLDAGQPVSLTLCGERSACRFETTPRTLWQQISQRWKTVDVRGLELG